MFLLGRQIICSNNIFSNLENRSQLVVLGGLGTSRRRHRLRYVEIYRMVVIRALEPKNSLKFVWGKIRTARLLFNVFLVLFDIFNAF